MKILYFLAHPQGIGGAAKQMITHAYIMRNYGHDIRLIIQSDDNGKFSQMYDELLIMYGLEYMACKYTIATCMEEIDIIQSIDDQSKIERVIKEFAPKIIHSLQINVSVELVASRLNIPHLMSIYQMADRMFAVKWTNVFAKYLCGDAELYCSQWERGLNIQSECIRVAYDNTKKEKPLPDVWKMSVKYRIINIAHFCKYKNQLEILKFVKKCKENGFTAYVEFLGSMEGQYGEICKKFVEDNNIEDQIVFRGFVGNVEDYLVQADVMIHASTVESFPGAVVEAMANKVPVIMTQAGGITELIEDGVNGLLVDGYNADAIYDKFLEYIALSKGNKIKDIVDRAYDTYLKNHTYEIVGKRLEAYYKRIIWETNNKIDLAEKSDYIGWYNDIIKFYGEKKLYLYSEYTQKHCWYLYHLMDICKDFNYAYVWGTGKLGNIGEEWCKILNLEILGYIDSNNSGTYMGYSVYSPKADVLGKSDCVIVSVANPLYVEDIMEILESAGRIRNKDYFMIGNDPCYVSTNCLVK